MAAVLLVNSGWLSVAAVLSVESGWLSAPTVRCVKSGWPLAAALLSGRLAGAAAVLN